MVSLLWGRVRCLTVKLRSGCSSKYRHTVISAILPLDHPVYLPTSHPASCFCDLNPINRLNAIFLELTRLKTAGTCAIIMALPPTTQPVAQDDYQKKVEEEF